MLTSVAQRMLGAVDVDLNGSGLAETAKNKAAELLPHSGLRSKIDG